MSYVKREIEQPKGFMLDSKILPSGYGAVYDLASSLRHATPPVSPQRLRFHIVWDNEADPAVDDILSRVLSAMQSTGAAMVTKVELM